MKLQLNDLILIGFFVSAIAPYGHRFLKSYIALLTLYPLALTIYFLQLIPVVLSEKRVFFSREWVPSLNINFDFYIDGLSLLFALLISGIGTLIFLYTSGYLHHEKYLGRFYLYLNLFMISMIGVVTSNNLFLLFVFWELTSIASFLLIGFNNTSLEARKNAWQALIVTSIGGLSLLAGLILITFVTQSVQISAILTSKDIIRQSPFYSAIIILVFVGAFTKSAQFPFHFWLPNAMVAPTPVSAYLHSATMVKAGIFLLARLAPVLSGTQLWSSTLSILGAITMIIGITMSLGQKDLKRILAYTTMSTLGLLTLLLGIHSPLAIQAAISYLLAHALYKGALFMGTGSIDHATHTRNIDQLGGLWKFLPITGISMILASLSMAAIPPLFGFIGKEVVYTAILEFDIWVIPTVMVSVAMTGLGFTIGLKTFGGSSRSFFKKPHESNWQIYSGPLVLGLLGFVLGCYPVFAEKIIQPACEAVWADSNPAPIHLALFHGINKPLIYSTGTLILGAIVFVLGSKIREQRHLFANIAKLGPQSWYNFSINGLFAIGRIQTNVLQNGYLRHYMAVIISFTIILITYPIIKSPLVISFEQIYHIHFYEWSVVFLLTAGSILAVFAKSRLTAIIAFSVVGLGVTLTFILFGAVDLAMTQIFVEILTVILFVFNFNYLPQFATVTDKSSHFHDIIVSVAFGVTITALILISSQVQWFEPISEYFINHSVSLGKGRNIVNVILVDFRALDTLGEIVVLCVAAIGGVTLIKANVKKGKDSL